MGYIAHDAVLVVTGDYRPGGLPDIDAFRESMPENFRQLVIGPVQSAANGEILYAFLPDGSKEGWETSDEGEYWREEFRNLFTYRYEDGSSPDDVVSVRFGGDFAYRHPPQITHLFPDDRKYSWSAVQ